MEDFELIPAGTECVITWDKFRLDALGKLEPAYKMGDVVTVGPETEECPYLGTMQEVVDPCDGGCKTCEDGSHIWPVQYMRPKDDDPELIDEKEKEMANE